MFAMSEYGHLVRVAMTHPRHVFTEARLDAHWRALHFAGRPDRHRAIDEFDRFLAILQSHGSTVHLLPVDEKCTLDSIYARDASLVSPRGPILCSMGKRARAAEPAAHRRAFGSLGVPTAGAITPPGTLEGGDVVWFDDLTINPDRTARNANLIVAHGRSWLIDHGSALYVHHAWTDPDAHARRPFERIADHVLLPFAGSMADADARLAPRLEGDALDSAIDAIPEEWLKDSRFGGASDERDAYRRYLRGRLDARSIWVAEAERARLEVQRVAA